MDRRGRVVGADRAVAAAVAGQGARTAAVPGSRCLQGILFVLHTGIGWEDLPQELGFGSGMTCWRRLQRWTEAGVFDQLHQLLLARLNAAGRIDWSRAAMDGSHIDAKKGVPAQVRRRSTAVSPAANTT
jgi:transposase